MDLNKKRELSRSKQSGQISNEPRSATDSVSILQSKEYQDLLLGEKIEENTYAFGVKIEEKQLSVKDQMKFYIDNGKSFMLHGPSGVGKTRRVQELDPDCICLQLRNGILPEEIIGKTGSVGKNSFWIEPTWYTRIKELCEKDPDHNHVLFIDELTNVNDKEQSLVFHIVLEHSIDGNMGALPKNCVVEIGRAHV